MVMSAITIDTNHNRWLYGTLLACLWIAAMQIYANERHQMQYYAMVI